MRMIISSFGACVGSKVIKDSGSNKSRKGRRLGHRDETLAVEDEYFDFILAPI
jgi:hypothetical protein